MAKIQSVQFPLSLGEANEIEVNVVRMNLETGTCLLAYTLLDVKQVVPGQDNALSRKRMFDGVLKMDEEAYNAWAQDNTYALQWVANQIGVTLL